MATSILHFPKVTITDVPAATGVTALIQTGARAVTREQVIAWRITHFERDGYTIIDPLVPSGRSVDAYERQNGMVESLCTLDDFDSGTIFANAETWLFYAGREWVGPDEAPAVVTAPARGVRLAQAVRV